MIGFPHPSSLIRYAHDRRADMWAEADRDRLIDSSRHQMPRRRLSGFATAVVAMFAIALLLAVGALVMGHDGSAPSGLLSGGDFATTRAAESHVLDPGAVAAEAANLSL